jgi:hypothetical protein
MDPEEREKIDILLFSTQVSENSETSNMLYYDELEEEIVLIRK